MNERRTPARRKDRQDEPHVRIPDWFYERVLPHLTPYEVKLWLALKTREWRKDNRGYVRVGSLRRIAKDIQMPRMTTFEAFQGLELKGLAKRMPNGSIRVLDPDFTTAFTTPFTTEVSKNGQRTQSGNVRTTDTPRPHHGHPRPYHGHQPGLSGFETNALTPGRSERRNRSARRKAPASRALSSEKPQNKSQPDEDRARRLTPGGDDARPLETKEDETMHHDEDELDVAPLTMERLQWLRRKALEAASEAEVESERTLNEHQNQQQQHDDERREFLRQQAAELQTEEKEDPKP